MKTQKQIIKDYSRASEALKTMCTDALKRRSLNELKTLSEMLPYCSYRAFVFSEIYTIENNLPSYNNKELK